MACAVVLTLLLASVAGWLGSTAGDVPVDPPPATVFIRLAAGTDGPDMAVYDGPDGLPIQDLEISNATDLGGWLDGVRISQTWIEVHESAWNRLRRKLGWNDVWSCASVESKTWNYYAEPPQTGAASAWNRPLLTPLWIELRRR